MIDVGGTHVKILCTGQTTARRFESGQKMTAQEMIDGVRSLSKGWNYDAVSIGYPGAVLRGRPIAEPYELGGGWVGCDFTAGLGAPVRLVNECRNAGCWKLRRWRNVVSWSRHRTWINNDRRWICRTNGNRSLAFQE